MNQLVLVLLNQVYWQNGSRDHNRAGNKSSLFGVPLDSKRKIGCFFDTLCLWRRWNHWRSSLVWIWLVSPSCLHLNFVSFRCTPGWLQFFHNAKCLSFMLGCCAFIQSFAVNAIFPVGLSTIEKQFHMTRWGFQLLKALSSLSAHKQE